MTPSGADKLGGAANALPIRLVMLDTRNQALAQFQSLAPDIYESPAGRELRSANEKLLRFESQAFSLASRGQRAAAASLLSGAYDEQQQLSSDATTRIAKELGSSAESALDFQRRRGRLVVIAVAVAVSLLLFTWVISIQIS